MWGKIENSPPPDLYTGGVYQQEKARVSMNHEIQIFGWGNARVFRDPESGALIDEESEDEGAFCGTCGYLFASFFPENSVIVVFA